MDGRGILGVKERTYKYRMGGLGILRVSGVPISAQHVMCTAVK